MKRGLPMLDHVEMMFDNMDDMLGNMKKKNYETNMKDFREMYGHYLTEMLTIAKEAQDADKALDEATDIFCGSVMNKFAKGGKIKSRKQADLNFFMIYYVFPAILMNEDENTVLVCDALKDKWNASFKNTNISYTTYEKIYEGFKEKIFGIF